MRAKVSAFASTASAILSRARERSCGVVSPQLSKARLAASTARWICSYEASGTSTNSSPVAGLSTFSASPSPRTNWPSMNSSVCRLLAKSGVLPMVLSVCMRV